MSTREQQLESERDIWQTKFGALLAMIEGVRNAFDASEHPVARRLADEMWEGALRVANTATSSTVEPRNETERLIGLLRVQMDIAERVGLVSIARTAPPTLQRAYEEGPVISLDATVKAPSKRSGFPDPHVFLEPADEPEGSDEE